MTRAEVTYKKKIQSLGMTDLLKYEIIRTAKLCCFCVFRGKSNVTVVLARAEVTQKKKHTESKYYRPIKEVQDYPNC